MRTCRDLGRVSALSPDALIKLMDSVVTLRMAGVFILLAAAMWLRTKLMIWVLSVDIMILVTHRRESR